VNQVIALVAAYLLGSIPFGFLAGRLRGVDLRSVGSGNIGAANAFRNLGRSWGIGVMVGDIGKGVAGALIGRWLTDDPWPIFVGAAVMVGAIFPVWLRFRGGKGVAAGGGVMIGLFPVVSLCLVPFWLLVVVTSRMTSLASILTAAAFAPLAFAFGYPWEYLVLAGAMALLVIVRHRANVGRLLAGNEAKIDLRRRQPAPPAATPPPGSNG
jgi:acyl phosphate:glycerol-3-phosphate acyltransferase